MNTEAGDGSHAPVATTLEAMPWQAWFAAAVRFVVAPLILFVSGFFTTDFLLSGAYTWPRTSRALALTLTVAILAYEFVYKEQKASQSNHGATASLARLLYSCLLPYGAGVLALLALVRIAS